MDPEIPDGYTADDEIDYEGPDPVWFQLAAILVARIGRGDYPPRRAIPSESQIMGEFGVARGTARKAIAFLAEQGLVRTVPGRGSFVEQPKPTEAPVESSEGGGSTS
ncbi:GntR family transcriptional regulator [Streptomyces sp. NPDC048385]|uniref:GntR family transcriptional regulator n=1 Tax=unclassified Streptomyces TaxID=2593676 RepID=UPI00342B0711